MKYNKDHGIVPTPIVKKSSGRELLEIYGEEALEKDTPTRLSRTEPNARKNKDLKNKETKKSAPRPYIEEEHTVSIAADPVVELMSQTELKRQADKLQNEMIKAARNTDFIEAARLRDELLKIKELITEPEQDE